MHLFFGLEFDDLVFPLSGVNGLVPLPGHIFLGPKKLLTFFEEALGIHYPPDQEEFLRVERYRQSIKYLLEKDDSAFCRESFLADSFGTTRALLNRRDELHLSGWDFELTDQMPTRLNFFSRLEKVFRSRGEPELSGYADRFRFVIDQISRINIIDEITLNEPIDFLPKHFIILFNKLNINEVKINSLDLLNDWENSDLGKFQSSFFNSNESDKRQEFAGDGSLIVVEASRDSDLAAWFSKLIHNNPDYHPLCLLPQKSRVLDNALVREGLPAMGIPSESLARPTLQILKLVDAFIWNPLDPYKILEFVSLSVNPLDEKLAALIGELISQAPGIHGESWKIRINAFLADLDGKNEEEGMSDPDGIRQQYHFWFNRKRYQSGESVPSGEIVEIFSYLHVWAIKAFKDSGKMLNSLLVLALQARRIKDLLLSLPDSESDVSQLQLERIIRSIYEAAPLTLRETEIGHLAHVYLPGAISGPVRDLVWWNFVDDGSPDLFPFWNEDEIEYLSFAGIEMDSIEMRSSRLNLLETIPFSRVNSRLILAVPQMLEGREVVPHHLLEDIISRASNPDAIRFRIGEAGNSGLFSGFSLPSYMDLPPKPLPSARPYLEVDHPDMIGERDQETYTSLNDLIFYPHKWVFAYKAKFRKSPILSIVRENTLLGNLAHRVFEWVFKKDLPESWTFSGLESFISATLKKLLLEEGSTLLLYGKEPERTKFERKLQVAAWTLINLIRQNNWKVKDTEFKLEGHFQDVPVKGIADLVLERENESCIVDLKWSGFGYRRGLIKNKRDLQLVLYARLLKPEGIWPHTAYFIMDRASMIAKNNMAFNEAVEILQGEDAQAINEEIWRKMGNTYQWRLKQFMEGKIEIRTEDTLPFLEEDYIKALETMELLEMEDGSARFDDYRTFTGQFS